MHFQDKLITRPLDYLEDYARNYGDIFKVGGKKSPPIVYLGNPQAIQEVFTASPELFNTSGGGGGILRFLLGSNSILMLKDKAHQRQRKLLMPPFHGERLRTYGDLICNITTQVTQSWEEGKPFLVRPFMQEITLRVILKAVFGLQEGVRYEQLRYLLSSLLDAMGTPFSSFMIFFPISQKDWGAWSPWGRFLRQKQEIDRLIYEEIQDRREKGDFSGSDILTLLMIAKDEAGNGMTDEELHDELMTLLIAGHETTASALTWALYWIHSLSEVKEKLGDELGSFASQDEKMEIVRLPYLNAVCAETLRIYPVALTTFPRVTKVPYSLLGYEFETGTVLFPCIYLVHHREDLYPNSKQFQPQRFLDKQFSPYEYFPFGGNPRRCIGDALAMMEMKLVLATILSHYSLSVASRRPVNPVRRGLTVAPSGNFRLVVTAVNSHQ